MFGEVSAKFDDDVLGDARECVIDLSQFSPLLLVECDCYSAGAGEAIVHIKPSNGLLMLHAALRAGDFDRLIVEN